MKLIKHCLGVLLVVLFLFPQVEKSLHALEHHDEFHCTESETHYHEAEHHCSICDYEVSHLISPVSVFQFEYLTLCISQPEVEFAAQYVKQPLQWASLRGPPFIS